MGFLKKVLWGLLALIIVLVAGGVTLGWMLSAHTTPESLARMAKSPQHRDGKFVNIEPEAGIEFTWRMISAQFFGDQQRTPLGNIPVVPIDASLFQKSPEPGLRLGWIGHATTLIEIDGTRILTDPVFAERVSPFSFAGPKRFHATPVALKDVQGIDGVVISHNHYDHFDEQTARHLAKQGTRFFIPLGNKAELLDWGVPETQIEEMDWWQETKIGSLKIIATPARHYSNRGTFDFQETLWASWSMIGPQHRVYFSGDTGYSKSFAEIGQKFGPFDATIIKVGSYGPGANWHDIHMPPEEAIQVHKDVRGAAMLPVHWGTFDLAHHAWDEPILRTVAAAEKAGVRLLTPKVGEIIAPAAMSTFAKWWENVE